MGKNGCTRKCGYVDKKLWSVTTYYTFHKDFHRAFENLDDAIETLMNFEYNGRES